MNLRFTRRSDRTAAPILKTVGKTIGAMLGLGALSLLARELPNLRRYLRIRRM